MCSIIISAATLGIKMGIGDYFCRGQCRSIEYISVCHIDEVSLTLRLLAGIVAQQTSIFRNKSNFGNILKFAHFTY